jgi:mRNA interferase RelE/StbE
MAQLRISDTFAKSAYELPKEAKAKLPKAFLLLTTNPRHPSLQVKKIDVAHQPNIYECRLDQSWRIIPQGLDGDTLDLLYVGSHDGVIRWEGVASKLGLADFSHDLLFPDSPLLCLEHYLAGEDQALNFTLLSPDDYQSASQHG